MEQIILGKSLSPFWVCGAFALAVIGMVGILAGLIFEILRANWKKAKELASR